jgi:hypothetical protein
MSSLIPTLDSTRSRHLTAWVPRLLLALAASLFVTSCFTVVGAPLWLSASIGALAGARVAASRWLMTTAPGR